MFLSKLFGRNTHADAAHALYGAAVARAREPVFYAELGVPDTLEGRFEMISIHVFLVLHRLKQEAGAGEPGGPLGQALFDLMFADMDRNLREMGAGDLGVGRRVKTMAAAFYGRVRAYDGGLDAGEEVLAKAVRRNVFNGAGSDAAAKAIARDMAVSAVRLAALPIAAVAAGEVAFGPLPEVKAVFS
jgi:cytochrome b pre-mRNA-processing protein 3